MRVSEEARFWGSRAHHEGWSQDAWLRSAMLVRILDRFQVHQSAVITEVGCGNLRNLWALSNSGYSHLSGIDITDEMQVPRIPNHPWNIVISEDLSQMPPCDVCITMASLQHIADIQTAIDSIKSQTSQLIILCECTSVSLQRFQFVHNYPDLIKWPSVLSLPAAASDGLGRDYSWQAYYRSTDE